MMGTGYAGGYRMPQIEVKEKFAWRPVRTTSGKWIWWRKYVKRVKFYWGPSGEGPATDADYFTENEWLIEQLRNTKQSPMPSSGKSGYY